MKLTKENLSLIVEKMNFQSNKDTVLIETGTYLGETCFELQDMFDEIHTIEIVPNLYEAFLIKKPSNVFAHLGDSSEKLLDVYNGNNKIIFWLDGHYVKDFERLSTVDCPLLEELSAINSKYKQECLILIDDVRLFDTYMHENWKGVNFKAILDTLGDRIIAYDFFDNERFVRDVMAIKIKAV